MRCFLRCFGSSNGKKPRRHATNRVPFGSKDQRRQYDSVKQLVYPGESLEKPHQAVLNHVIIPIEQAACLNERKLESPTGLISLFQNRDKCVDALIDDEEEAATGKVDLASRVCLNSRSAEKSADKLRSEDGSVNSSLVSYPVNHRYQNHRESDDEKDDLDYNDSYMDVADSESEDDDYTDDNELSDSVCSMESTSKISSDEQQTQHMAVDASLSNWLPSPETKAFQNVLSPEINPQCPLSPKNLKDRPILGALTVEELKLMSPDDMAIIGSVGSPWSSQETDKDSAGSVSSYKGIPNTTSKYREDKRVNWHSTPFETRLEKALSRGSARA